MKIALYTLSYLDGVDGFGNNRLIRNVKYLQYYHSIKEKLGFDAIFMADNASDYNHIDILAKSYGDGLHIMRFEPHLTRKGPYDYPYCWRGLYAMRELMNAGYEKIITIDSDCYVLTSRLAEYIKNLNSGWTSFFCQKYNFPEASVHILCKDTYSLFDAFIQECRWEDREANLPMEMLIPFTHINRAFNCDRWGETRAAQTPDMDLYCQSMNDFKPRFL